MAADMAMGAGASTLYLNIRATQAKVERLLAIAHERFPPHMLPVDAVSDSVMSEAEAREGTEGEVTSIHRGFRVLGVPRLDTGSA